LTVKRVKESWPDRKPDGEYEQNEAKLASKTQHRPVELKAELSEQQSTKQYARYTYTNSAIGDTSQCQAKSNHH
jgi:hypothetical protein